MNHLYGARYQNNFLNSQMIFMSASLTFHHASSSLTEKNVQTDHYYK